MAIPEAGLSHTLKGPLFLRLSFQGRHISGLVPCVIILFFFATVLKEPL